MHAVVGVFMTRVCCKRAEFKNRANHGPAHLAVMMPTCSTSEDLVCSRLGTC
jgi:hypothetical protein